MSESVLLAIVIAVALVTVVALYLNRRLKITSPKGSVEVGADQLTPGAMSVSASGPGSSVKGSKQIQEGGAGPAMKIEATNGGTVEDQEQRSGNQ